MINVLLVDDHAYVLKGLRHMLDAEDEIHVMAVASNGIEAVAHIDSGCPDVVVVDISMPLMDGIETARQILLRCAQTRVLMLSIFDHPEYVQRALEAGAAGFVIKDDIGDDLVIAIRTVHGGRRYFSERVAGTADQYLNQGRAAS